MDKNELAKRLMATFLEELHEHIDAINRDLLVLEKKPTDAEQEEALKLLFRSAHSLKGASRAVNVEVIEDACHILEDILDEVRDEKREIDAPLFAKLFQVADAIQDVGMRLREGQGIADAPLHALLPDLRRAAGFEPAETAGQHDAATGDATTDDATTVERPRDEAVEAAGDTAGQPMRPAKSDAPQYVSLDTNAKQIESTTSGSEAPAAEHVAGSRSTTTAGSVRVAAEKLDALLAQNGELLVARRRVEQRSSDAEELTGAIVALRNQWNQVTKPLLRMLEDEDPSFGNGRFQLPIRATQLLVDGVQRLAEIEKQAERLATHMMTDARMLQQTCDALDEEVHQVRMLPFAEACGGLQRAVRDIAHATAKQVELVTYGEDVEVDRSVLEGLKDPLMHLVRNAVDHGIESPEVRQSVGKEPQGRVTVSAELHGGHVQVVVADDGGGFDLRRIRDKAVKLGIDVPAEAGEQARMVLLPGFSTAKTVTDVSGRGVGLDVVESAVQGLRGSIDIDFEPGVGSRFIITVPLTLTTVRCVLANVADQTYAIPSSSVQQIVRFDRDAVCSVVGGHVLRLGDTPTPVTRLSDLLGRRVAPASDSRKLLAIVIGTTERRAAVVVDELLAEQEVLVKNLGSRIRRVRLVSGATLLPSGRVALVLNSTNVLNSALGTPTKTGFTTTEKKPERRRPRLLVVDDSVTTRTMLKGILEAAQYDVSAAADGAQGWQMLESSDFDLVVSDVDMPRLNGFELTRKIRSSSTIAEMPVVLVTARATDEDKKRGVQVGASAYIEKGSFNQNVLLQVIEQFL